MEGSGKVYDEINTRYGAIAKSGNSSDEYASNVAKAFGYSDEELSSVPKGANLGLGCGNPIALANLREGEIVIDIGCGGGLDVITAARKVGTTGAAIGVDINKDMLQRASGNVSKADVTNVRFIESPATKITIQDATADCIVSNCVINLVPAEEKQLAFNEMYRVLKPGGRVAISDILARKKLPEDMTKSIALQVGCIAGASQVSQYETYLGNAGFKDIRIVDSESDLNVYLTATEDGPTAGCCSIQEREASRCCPPSQIMKEIGDDLRNLDWNEWAGSFQIYALKPCIEQA